MFVPPLFILYSEIDDKRIALSNAMPIRYDLVDSQFHLQNIYRNVDVGAKLVLRSGVIVEGVTKSNEEVEGSLSRTLGFN
jgi:hypothetical protein